MLYGHSKLGGFNLFTIINYLVYSFQGFLSLGTECMAFKYAKELNTWNQMVTVGVDTSSFLNFQFICHLFQEASVCTIFWTFKLF